MQDGSIRPLLVKTGETVLFGKYAGQTVKLDDDEYLVLKEEDILGVIENASGGQARKAA
jgi:chaperonin GroES